MELFTCREGSSPLLVSMPHVGTHIPDALAERMTPAALALPDTDWHLERLYDFLDGLGASVLVATHSRYVIDLNRAPDNVNLYPGQDSTGLCPVDTFAREPVYLEGAEPPDAEIGARVRAYWRPYHDQLRAELARLRRAYGFALLWDAHSILSHVPRFFSGRLPDINLGTADGKSCGAGIGEALLSVAARSHEYRAVLNGRFKGGYITRRYGNPVEGVHAMQLELAEITYMQERAPFEFSEILAMRVRPRISALLEEFLRLAPIIAAR